MYKFKRLLGSHVACGFKAIAFLTIFFAAAKVNGQQVPAGTVNMVFTSDAHYGITRPFFRGDSNATGHKVNAAMIRQINTVPALRLPNDKGVNAGQKVAHVDYLVQTGDIANRMDKPVQTAAASWKEFEVDYVKGLQTHAQNGNATKLLIVPGNHDISNAIGSPKPMTPLTDATAMVNIYNMMLKPARPLNNQNYNYANHKVNYSLNINGVHMMFITLWPDSAERIWMQKDLENVKMTTPVILFTHDQPVCQDKHFTNPVPPFELNASAKFENLTTEHYKEGNTAGGKGSTDIEQRGWVTFLKAHPNIKAYFHGNSNYNEFYTYHGPDDNVNLPVFRVDSPMKGKYSEKDEKLLSFQLISINGQKQLLTVRECLWNTDPLNPSQTIQIGKTTTISLR
jgi:hypothetical protein